jgi:AraC family transcriptional regulator of adaptative response / DNA-3-methyladenine glycosylase II
LAARLGVGDRQLRRLFDQHLGASPAAVARAQRLQAARAMIDQTSLPMLEISAAAGFQSLRQFNHAVRQTFGASPRELRKTSLKWAVSLRERECVAMRLPYRPPFDWRGMLAFLAVRATPGVEVIDGDVYRRAVQVGDTVGWVEVGPAPGAAALPPAAVAVRWRGVAAGGRARPARLRSRRRSAADRRAAPHRPASAPAGERAAGSCVCRGRGTRSRSRSAASSASRSRWSARRR